MVSLYLSCSISFALAPMCLARGTHFVDLHSDRDASHTVCLAVGSQRLALNSWGSECIATAARCLTIRIIVGAASSDVWKSHFGKPNAGRVKPEEQNREYLSDRSGQLNSTAA